MEVKLIDWNSICSKNNLKVNREMIERLMRTLMEEYGMILTPKYYNLLLFYASKTLLVHLFITAIHQ